MTTLPPSQPMTRRERRLLEQSDQSGMSSLTETPSAAPIAESPVVHPPAVPTPPLSRRERRLLEEQGGAPEFQPAQALVTAVSTDAVKAVTTASQPVVVPPTVTPSEPLPPVFGTPVTSAEQPRVATQPHDIVSDALSNVAAAPVRFVGDVPTTTSSLILPTTPTIDMTSPLSSTGEVVVTGQITLPSTLAEQGTTPLLDRSPDNDEVMDAYVTGEIAAMSKPVRASQAVSTKGDDTDILLVRKARWGVAAISTVIVAAALGLAAAGLLVYALMTDVAG